MKRSQRFKRRAVFECLEDRQLLAAPITEFPISAGSRGITAGPDGNFWFTLSDDQIGRITPAGQVTEFPIPASSSGPNRITAGPDGNLWFTSLGKYQIGRITPAGQIIVFPTPGGNHSSAPFDIEAGPDGNLWFTEINGNKVGRITPSGQVTEFPVSLYPGDIKTGPDGNLWFTETENLPPSPGRRDTIGRVTPSGQVSEYVLRGFLMSGEAFGPDGNLWFAQGVYEPFLGGYKRAEFLTRINAAGQITEMPIFGFAGAGELAFAPDGNLWYTENVHTVGINAIGRITPAGFTAQFSVPTAGAEPVGIVAEPDGNVLFTEAPGNIGRFRVSTTDLGLTIPSQTVTGTTGQPLSYTISVTNHGPVLATDVVLTEDELSTSTVPGPIITTPSDSNSVSTSQGTVKRVAGGGFVAELGKLASGATATVTVVVTSANPQTTGHRLFVHANESDTNPGNDFATLTAIISQGPSSSPPHVLGLRSIRGKKGLTGLVVRFDQPMDTSHVNKTAIYHLVILGKGKHARPRAVGLSAASYDAGSRSVRLSLKKPVKSGKLRLTIDHSGAIAASGIALSGGDYVSIVPK